MGRPFLSELQQLDTTYAAMLAADVSALASAVAESTPFPLVAVGSGGSLSAAHFVSYLHEKHAGQLARVATPLEVISLLADSGARWCIRNSAAICLSAGGSNMDINRAFRAMILAEPRRLTGVCARKNSRLSKAAAKYQWVDMFGYDLPSKKDGFLATNSLLAFVLLLARAYGMAEGIPVSLPSSLWHLIGLGGNLETALEKLRHRLRPVLARDNLLILHGVSTRAAAWDLESKFTEAALGSVSVADYRNFAHGRHHWLAKRGETSAVMALTGDIDADLASRTAALLPSSVPSVFIRTSGGPIQCAIGSILKTLLITAIAGETRGIDPGRPKVPEFGRRLYHLGVGSITRPKSTPAPVLRKAATCRRPLSEISRAYAAFTRAFRIASFSVLAVDYDGTLSGPRNRFGPLGETIARELARILRKNTFVGIATGRGKSVKEALRDSLPRATWNRVIVGYYNGAECAPLSVNTAPHRVEAPCPELEPLATALRDDACLQGLAILAIREQQVTLELARTQDLELARELVGRHIAQVGDPGIRMVVSSHSVDILAPGVSKRKLIDLICTEYIDGRTGTTLCIGDQGRWPGNDFDLLSLPHGLSVDTVSSDLHTCWNIAPAGYRGTQAALYYLQCIESTGQTFTFDTRRGKGGHR